MNKILSEQKNPTAFWNLVNTIKEKKSNNSCIEPNVFYDYFRNLFDCKTNDNFDNKFESVIECKLCGWKNWTNQ